MFFCMRWASGEWAEHFMTSASSLRLWYVQLHRNYSSGTGTLSFIVTPDLWLSIQCPAAQLVNPSRQPCRLRFWHDQLFAKPPHHGGVVAWYVVPIKVNREWSICFILNRHQDYSYWTRTKPMMHITVRSSYFDLRKIEINIPVQQVHIALDDQTGDRGGLQFIPGSHRYRHPGITHCQLR